MASTELVTRVANQIYTEWNPDTSGVRELIVSAVRLGMEIAAGERVPVVSGVTAKQRELLLFLVAYTEEHGHTPSYDEMRAALGLASKSGVHRMVTALEERGAIRRLPYRARAIEVVALPKQVA